MKNQLFELQMPDYRKAAELLLEALHTSEAPVGEDHQHTTNSSS
ncbi:MAG: hypothetical protein ACI3V0_11250 [Faecousia sp.]